MPEDSVSIRCEHCGHVWNTRAKDGSIIHCANPICKRSLQVRRVDGARKPANVGPPLPEKPKAVKPPVIKAPREGPAGKSEPALVAKPVKPAKPAESAESAKPAKSAVIRQAKAAGRPAGRLLDSLPVRYVPVQSSGHGRNLMHSHSATRVYAEKGFAGHDHATRIERTHADLANLLPNSQVRCELCQFPQFRHGGKILPAVVRVEIWENGGIVYQGSVCSGHARDINNSPDLRDTRRLWREIQAPAGRRIIQVDSPQALAELQHTMPTAPIARTIAEQGNNTLRAEIRR